MQPFSTWSLALPRLAVVLGSSAVSVAADPLFVRGDVNLDGQVTFGDVGFLLEALHSNAAAPRCQDAADVNDNGFNDVQGATDWEYLRDWLFRAGPQPPAPFPLPGPDPTNEINPLGCAESNVTPSKPVPGYTFDWEHDLELPRGARDQEVFLRLTTAGPVTGFSLACRVDRRFLTNLRVDFEGTIVPLDARKELLTSRYFRELVSQSASPNHDLLLVGAIFLDDTSGLAPLGVNLPPRIGFPATEEPVEGARILRLLADVLPDAPVTGSRTELILPIEASDGVPGLGTFRHGLLNEMLARDFVYPIEESLVHVEAAIVVNAGEFLRGDANADACRDISDAVHTLSFLFLGGGRPQCPDASDSNDDGRLDTSDAIFLLSYLYLGGSPPPTAPLIDPALCWFDATADSLDEVLGRCEYRCRACGR